MLRHYCNDHMDDWDAYLAAVEFAYNSSKHASTGFTPFYMNYAYEPTTPLELVADARAEHSSGATDFLARLRSVEAEAKAHLEAARKRMAANVDAHKREHGYKAGDKVWLSTANLRSPKKGKLSKPFCGPYKIVEMVSKNAAKLELPNTMRIHPVRNVSELKPCVEPEDARGQEQAPAPAPFVNDAGNEVWEVEALENRRSRKVKGRKTYDYYVKWKGFPATDNMWVNEKTLIEDGLEETIKEYDERHPRDARGK
jgi:hypothetical protein